MVYLLVKLHNMNKWLMILVYAVICIQNDF
jgi:hypothetical protein